MKKILAIITLFSFISSYLFVFSNQSLAEVYLYYSDTDNNSKIDSLEIEFNNQLTGSINLDKIFLYSDTGGLSNSKLDSVIGSSIFSSYSLSGTNLLLKLTEQDNYNTGLIINNTTSSHLRLKTNSGFGIKDIYGNEVKLLYTSSFFNYTNVGYKNYDIIQTQINTGEVLLDTGSENIINPEIIEEINTDTGSIDSLSGGISTNSGDVLSLSGDALLSTGADLVLSAGEQSGIINSTGTIFRPKYSLSFQSPSYLLEKEDEEASIFNCDNTKTDCKVNYNIAFESPNYLCEWNFGIGKTTGEEAKCNPNTISYPIGEIETSYKICDKTDISRCITNKLRIKNTGYHDTSTKIVYASTSSSQSNLENHINIDNPKIIVQSGLDEQNNCKSENCSINLLYETKNGKEACLWSFSGGNYSNININSCNPGYVSYPFGDFKISLKVYEIGYESNYRETFLDISNKKNEKHLDLNIAKSDLVPENMSVTQKKDENIKKFLRISRILANPIGADTYEWIELENTYSGSINLKGCEIQNLGKSIKKYKINTDLFLNSLESKKLYKNDTNLTIRNSSGASLNLYCDKELIDNFSWNFDTPEAFVLTRDILQKEVTSIIPNLEENSYIIKFADSSEIDIEAVGLLASSNNEDKKELISTKQVKSIIELQGKLSKNKILQGNKLICSDIDECSVNLDGSSSKGNKLKYFWDFGNGKTFEKSNPARYTFYEGKYTISLKVSDENSFDISYFTIEVIPKSTKTKEKKENYDIKTDDSFIPQVNAMNDSNESKNTSNNFLLYTSILSVLGMGLLGFALKWRNII